jgi:hypothetical protein
VAEVAARRIGLHTGGQYGCGSRRGQSRPAPNPGSMS